MKKYSLKYHLLNEVDSPVANSIKNDDALENQENTFPFNLDLGEFGKINSNLTTKSILDLLFLVKLEDQVLFEEIINKLITPDDTLELIYGYEDLIDILSNMKNVIQRDIVNVAEDLQKYRYQTSQPQSLTASFKINKKYKKFLLEDESEVNNQITAILNKILDDEDKKNAFIDKVKEIQENLEDSELFNENLKEAISNLPTEDQLENIITSVVNQTERSKYRESIEVALLQTLGLHKPSKILTIMDNILKHVRNMLEIKNQLAENINDPLLEKLLREAESTMLRAVEKIGSLNNIIRQYREETGINFEEINNNPDLHKFFTNQGTKIGYLLEDIIGSVYNGTSNTMSDNKLSIFDVVKKASGRKKEEVTSTRTKPYALAMCAVMLNKLDEIAGRGKIITSANYKSCLVKFVNKFMSGGDNVTNLLKANMNNILDIKDSYMFSIDKILKETNTGFDFLISESNEDVPGEGSKVAIFDLKSSHKDSVSVSAAATASGSNKNNFATNELIRLSNIPEVDIIDNSGVQSNIKYNKYDYVDEKSSQKNYNIHCVCLIKVKWRIADNKFTLDDVLTSMSSLNGATKYSSTTENLLFFPDDRESPRDFALKDKKARPAMRNVSLFDVIDPREIKTFNDYIESQPKKIVKENRSDVLGLELFYNNYKKYFNVDEDYLKLKTKGVENRKKNEGDEMVSLYKFFLSETPLSLENYKGADINVSDDAIDSISMFFADEKKIKSIKYGLTYLYKKPQKVSAKLVGVNEPRLAHNGFRTLYTMFQPDSTIGLGLDTVFEYDTNDKLKVPKTSAGYGLSKTNLKDYLDTHFSGWNDMELNSSHNRKGKVLREVYSYLFRK